MSLLSSLSGLAASAVSSSLPALLKENAGQLLGLSADCSGAEASRLLPAVEMLKTLLAGRLSGTGAGTGAAGSVPDEARAFGLLLAFCRDVMSKDFDLSGYDESRLLELLEAVKVVAGRLRNIVSSASGQSAAAGGSDLLGAALGGFGKWAGR